jgi:hypothetical protein
MRIIAVSLFALGVAVARPAAAQTPVEELPAPYLQQVPPQAPPQQPPGAPAMPAVPPTAAPQPQPLPPDQVYGVEGQPEYAPADQPTVEQVPPVYQQEQPEAQPSADDYAGEYDLSTDNTVAQSYDDGYDPQAAAQFDQTLSPYGTWVDDPSYGRVWEPSVSIVGAGFFPYATGGHWVLTEFGWTWVSDWDWGWAPFHYGRWTVVGRHGWCWVPGTLWGPAWVGWRAGGGYVGWTPLPPRGVWIGQPVGRGSHWRFTSASALGTPHPAYVSPRAIGTVFARTSVVSNARTMAVGGSAVAVNAGPTRILSASPTGRLAEVAPHAAPRFAVQPRVATPLATRPWVRAGLTAAPASFGRPVSHTGAPFRATAAPVPAFRGPVYTNGVRAGFGGPAPAHTFVPHSSVQYAPRGPLGRPAAGWQGGVPTYTTVAPIYHAPPRAYAPTPYRAFTGPRYATPAPMPHYAAPHVSAPAAPHFSPAPHFSAPRPSGGGGHPSFGGGGHRR